MSQAGKRDFARNPMPDALAALDTLLASRVVLSPHYVGYCHESVLRLLHQHFGTAFGVMDYWNFWGTESEFDYDSDERVHDSRLPPWLVGVPFYSEGSPDDRDLLIWDMPWHYPDHLSVIVASDLRPAPTYLFLMDEACSESSHPAFTWSVAPHYAIGTLKIRNA